MKTLEELQIKAENYVSTLQLMDFQDNEEYKKTLKECYIKGALSYFEYLKEIDEQFKVIPKEPKKELYGWYDKSSFDDEPSGWLLEGGEEAYYRDLEAYLAYNLSEKNINMLNLENKICEHDDSLGKIDGLCMECFNKM